MSQSCTCVSLIKGKLKWSERIPRPLIFGQNQKPIKRSLPTTPLVSFSWGKLQRKSFTFYIQRLPGVLLACHVGAITMLRNAYCGRIKSNILQISKQLSTPKYIVIEGFSFFITADLNNKSVSFEFSANTIGLFSLQTSLIPHKYSLTVVFFRLWSKPLRSERHVNNLTTKRRLIEKHDDFRVITPE